MYVNSKIMLLNLMKRYRSMILVSVFFFYIGCGITLSFLRLECADALSAFDKSIELISSMDTKQNLLSNVEYVVLIISAPNNEAKRDAIRTTWVKLARNIFIENNEILYKWNHTRRGEEQIIKCFFVLGTQGLTEPKLKMLKTENSKNNDLLLLDSLEDSYKNLTSKMLHSLRWINRNMKGLKYLIKCDDDSFVRIDLIVRDLDAYAPEMNAPEISEFVSFKKNLKSYKGLYWGYFNGRAKVYLDGKWQENDWFLCDSYLPYALGGGYVISRSIVNFISQNVDFLRPYNSEDVSIGVWTAPLDGINRVHDIRFDTEWKSRGCSRHALVLHKQTPSDMFQLYKYLVISHGQNPCKTESSERKSYLYNWDVLPSMCCK